MFNRHEKIQNDLIVAKGRFLIYFQKITFFEIFEIISSTYKTSLKSFYFWLNMVEEPDKTRSIYLIGV